MEKIEIRRSNRLRNFGIAYGIALLAFIIFLIFIGDAFPIIIAIIVKGAIILPFFSVPKYPLVFTESGLTYSKGFYNHKRVSVPYHQISEVLFGETYITIVHNGTKFNIVALIIEDSEWIKVISLLSDICVDYNIPEKDID